MTEIDHAIEDGWGPDRRREAGGWRIVFDKGARWPGELHVARALFTDPLDREPQMHAYYDTHVSWVTLGDSLLTRPDPAAAAGPGGPPQ